jgi:ssRNA-specific RNase YbeY (16S rRNA maturation enzyme)
VVELLQRQKDIKILLYFEDNFHTTHHEFESQDARTAVMSQNARQNRWGIHLDQLPKRLVLKQTLRF